ncbi:unnamed protein product [Echinostoma caproni]|uniref:GGACT domain-containing protein n=1 Tax=Echinostoma caproni TaxID=27848 RepID=A0A183B7K4_9TREM|nr:unnamed protein product [Echinostoma caproni]
MSTSVVLYGSLSPGPVMIKLQSLKCVVGRLPTETAIYDEEHLININIRTTHQDDDDELYDDDDDDDSDDDDDDDDSDDDDDDDDISTDVENYTTELAEWCSTAERYRTQMFSILFTYEFVGDQHLGSYLS